MRSGRFPLTSLSLKHRLPLLIATPQLDIIAASKWASYRRVKESAFGVGRERLQNLTQQLARLSQQSTGLLRTKIFTPANEPEIRAFPQSSSHVSNKAAPFGPWLTSHRPKMDAARVKEDPGVAGTN
jgi:hypothetical protein